MIVKLIFQLIKLQWLQLIRHWARHSLLALTAFSGFLLLYILNFRLIFPKATGFLAKQFEAVESSQAEGLFFVALLHLCVTFFLAGPYFSQMHQLFQRSGSLRIFHLRVRSPLCIALCLQVECLVVMVFMEFLFSPILWLPFHNLDSESFTRLLVFKTLLIGILLSLLTFWLAVRHRIDADFKGALLFHWVVVLAFYGLFTWLGFEAYKSFHSPAHDQVFVRLLKVVHTVIYTKTAVLRYGTGLLVWLCLVPLTSLTLGKAIGKYGL